jgi:DNA-directed RNA polymerase subunit RPC12/RpoP
MTTMLDFRDDAALQFSRSEFVARYLQRLARLVMLVVLPCMILGRSYPIVGIAGMLFMAVGLILAWTRSRSAGEWYDSQQNSGKRERLCPCCDKALLSEKQSVTAGSACPHCGFRSLHDPGSEKVAWPDPDF